MTFLDKPVCNFCCCGMLSKTSSATTIGDIFKLIIPIGWSAVALMACLAYLLSPLSRGDPPRWSSAALVALSAAAGIGLSVAIYSFHRKTSSFAVEENYAESGNDGNGDGEHGGEESPQNTSATIPTEQQQQRQRVLRIHAILSLSGAIMSIVLLIFFGVFASDLDKCAHETCGADVSWSCITLVISLSWMGVTYLGHRHLQRQRERERQRIRLPENEKGTNRAVGSDENGEGSEIP